MPEPFEIKLVGKHGVPETLLEAMRKHGIDPRAAYVESAEGWRYGDPEVDLSSDEQAEETLALAVEAVRWVEEQAARSKEFRKALGSVQVFGDLPDEVALRVERAAGSRLARPGDWTGP